MDSVLIDHWLGGRPVLPILDAASVAVAREQTRALAAKLGMSPVVAGSLVNVVSELGHNQLAHARYGSIALCEIERDGVSGIEVIAADTGPGIADPRSALRGRAPLAMLSGEKQSLGVGLSAVLELSDETDFDVRLGEGSCIWARKFERPVRRRREVGIYGRPFPEEPRSGDHALFVRSQHDLLLSLCDGLGHGHFARVASDMALNTVHEHAHAGLERIFEEVHAALINTRGAVLAAARVHEPEGRAETASLGNVDVRIYGPQRAQRVAGPGAVLGARGNRTRPAFQDHALGTRDVLIFFSDGLRSRFELSTEPELLLEKPVVIAQELLERFARDNDDALVLVAR